MSNLGMTPEEAQRALARLYPDIPKSKVADAVARLEEVSAGSGRIGPMARPMLEQVATAQEIPDILWPLKLTIPWSALCSDNAKYIPVLRGPRPALMLSTAYRDSKRKAAMLAKRAMGDAGPYDQPVRLIATVWVPDKRTHDTVNFAKNFHDALTDVVITDDKLIHSALWQRAGVDVDQPRADVVIEPI